MMDENISKGNGSMRHGVIDDIDTERVGLLFGKLSKVIFAFALTLPPIAVIGVVANHGHDPAFVIENGLQMRLRKVLKRGVEAEPIDYSRLDSGFVLAQQTKV